MSTKYNEEFKKQVVQEYMKGTKSTIKIAAEYNIAKSTVCQWAKNYSEECQYTTTSSEPESAKEIRRLNQQIKEQEKEIAFLKKDKRYYIINSKNEIILSSAVNESYNYIGGKFISIYDFNAL